MKKYILMAFLLSFLTSNLFAFMAFADDPSSDDSSSLFPTEAIIKEKLVLTLRKAFESHSVSISEESIELNSPCEGWFSFFDYDCRSYRTYYTVEEIQLTINDKETIVLEECEIHISAKKKENLPFNYIKYFLQIQDCEFNGVDFDFNGHGYNIWSKLLLSKSNIRKAPIGGKIYIGTIIEMNKVPMVK